MPITTLKVLASLIQLHGPGATVQSDHQGIDALLHVCALTKGSSQINPDNPSRLRTRGFCRRGECRRLSQSGLGY